MTAARHGSGRGGGWVAAQFVVMAAILVVGGATDRWPDGVRTLLAVVGVVIGVGGAAVAVWSARALGRSLTPFPRPAAGGELVEAGPYRIVRHPIYGAGTAFFVGVSLLVGPVALVLTGLLAVLWALKSRVEERHLRSAYPAYSEYARRVRYRIVPYLY